jgi:hypothetical protein
MSTFSLASAVVALALIPASSALAAAPWSPPVSVATGEPQLAEPTIAFVNNGRALLSARITSEAQGVPSRGFSRLFGQQPDGSFAGRGRVVLAAPPAVYGQSRLALVRLPLTEGNLTVDDLARPESSLGYSFGRTAGSLEVDTGAYRRLTTRADRNDVAIASNDRGDIAVVWVEHLSGRDHLVAALRRPNRPFGRPAVIVGSGFLSSPAVTWSARSDLLVSYQRSISHRGRATERRVEARVRRAGRSWGRPQRLGVSSGFSQISVAAAPNGRMLVAWGTQDLGEEANTPWIVRAAQRPAGPRAFRAAQELERSEGIERPAGRVAAALAPDGKATVAWSSITGARFPSGFPARVATADSSLRFGAPQTLAPNAAVGDVTSDNRGATLVVWVTLPQAGNNQTTSQVFANLRAAGAPAFAAAEQVSPVEHAALPRAAFDPKTRRPAVVWISRTSDTPQQLRFAARTG